MIAVRETPSSAGRTQKSVPRFWRLLSAFQEICELIAAGDVPRIGALIRPAPPSQKLTSLRIRPLGGRPVAVRNGTTDFATLRTTFKQRYHRPFGRLPEHCIILDLGCNVGYTVLDHAYQYPKSWVIGVELDADNFRLAQKNTCTVKNVT